MLSFRLRNQLHTSLSRWFSSSMVRCIDQKYDSTQLASMNENCFIIDEFDKVIGTASKKECHLIKPDGTLPLHRAFSVFLFNNHGDLLLQKRSSEKITYPDHYTNSCCSHPIADIPLEDDENDALGIKRAARRRLNFELGIPLEEVPLEKLEYITRIHYKDFGNGKWGEHEIDYVLFLKADVTIKPNPNEISEISFVPRKELDAYIPTLEGPLTPWFKLILKSRLKLWWDNLDNLNEYKNHETILKL